MSISFRLSGLGRIAVSQVDSSSAWGAPLYGEIETPEIPFIRRHWSSTGRSDSSAGGGDDRKLAASAGQNWLMITPCGIYMNPSRTGGLYVLPWAAEPMTSNRGKPSEAPSPFRQVRRSIITRFIGPSSLPGLGDA